MTVDRSKSVPLYQQLKEIVKEKIKNGEIKPGDKLPSESEFITKHDVSRQVVRQALKELANEGWIYQEQGKGTFCLAIQSETPNWILNIAVVIQSITEYFFPKLVRGIEEVAYNHGYKTILCQSDNNPVKEALYLQDHMKNRTSGFIVDLTKDITPYPNLRYFQEMKKKGIPFVTVDKYLDGADYDYVKLDNIGGLYKATKYLIDLGHRRIAYISFEGISDRRIINERWQGYKRALIDHRIPYREELVRTLNPEVLPLVKGHTRGEKWMDEIVNELLNLGKIKPTAILCFNDNIAIIILRKLKEKGLKIPEDISIIGFDDYDFSKETNPPLTTIVHPVYEMGKRTAGILFDKIEGKQTQLQQITFPATLIERTSCRKIG